MEQKLYNTLFKICWACGNKKCIDNFCRCAGNKDGYKNQCRDCLSKKSKQFRKDNLEQVHIKSKAYVEKNRKAINEGKLKSHYAHKEKNNKSCRDYYRRNKDKILKRAGRWTQNRLKTDINFKLSHNLRSRLRRAMEIDQKTGSAVSDLGCTIDELKMHLEAKFYPNPETGEEMTWDNWGRNGWHVDHRIPLITIKTASDKELQTKICCHYINLQPLWEKENISKSGKVPEDVEKITEEIKAKIQ